MLEYIEVKVSLSGKIHGSARFPLGEGNEAYYMHRAQVLSKPYLPADALKSNLEWIVAKISSTVDRIINSYIPVIT